MAQKNGSNGLPLGSGLYWNGGIIYASFWHNGKRQAFSTHTDDPKEALKIRDARKHDLETGEHVVVAKFVRMNEVLDDYLKHLRKQEDESGEYMSREYERTSYKAACALNKHMRPLVGHLKPEQVTREMLETWKDKKIKDGSPISTTNTVFRLLKAAMNLAADHHPPKVSFVVVKTLFGSKKDKLINIGAEKKREQTGVIELEQFRQVMAELAPHLKPFFAAAYWTGAREKELKFARRENMKWKEYKLYFSPDATKPGHFKFCGINDELFDILKDWEKQTAKTCPETPWLFHQSDGKQIGAIKTGWNSALRRCGLRVPVLNPDGTPKMRKSKKTGKLRRVEKNLVKFHDTRRSMNTMLEDEGVEERHMMGQSGHLTPGQNRKYSQSRKAADVAREAQNRILAKEKGQTPEPVSKVVPAVSDEVLMGHLKELATMFKDGLLSREKYDYMTTRLMTS